MRSDTCPFCRNPMPCGQPGRFYHGGLRGFLYRWGLEIAMVTTMSVYALATIIPMFAKP